MVAVSINSMIQTPWETCSNDQSRISSSIDTNILVTLHFKKLFPLPKACTKYTRIFWKASSDPNSKRCPISCSNARVPKLHLPTYASMILSIWVLASAVRQLLEIKITSAAVDSMSLTSIAVPWASSWVVIPNLTSKRNLSLSAMLNGALRRLSWWEVR